MSISTHCLALVPRDGFFVKDGRGWQTSARTSVLDWPWPTTVRGALTTVSGKIAERQTGNRFGPKDWKDRQSKIAIGPLVALRRTQLDGPWRPMWPVPADALWLEGSTTVLRLKPKSPATRRMPCLKTAWPASAPTAASPGSSPWRTIISSTFQGPCRTRSARLRRVCA